MTKKVDIGNGYFANFPDDASESEIETALNEQFPPTSSAPPAENKLSNRRSPVMTALGEAGNAATFGLARRAGAAIGSGISQFTDNPVGPTEAFQRASAADTAAAEANPGSALAGQVGGSLLSGAAIVRQAPSLALKGGQMVRNAARLAGAGTAGGGLTAAGEGGTPSDIVQGAEYGAGGGLVGGAVGKVGSAVVRSVAGKVSGAARNTNAVRTLAKQVQMQPRELTAALDNFARQNGRQASVSDVLDLQAKGRLKEFARDNPAFGAEVAKEAERRATQPPKIQGGARARNQPQDVASLQTARNQRMDAAMKPIEGKRVLLPAGSYAALKDPDMYEALPRSLRRKVLDADEGGAPLTIRDLENIRQAFRSKAASGEKFKYNEYAKDIEKLASAAEPEYGKALAKFASDSRYIEAFEHGRLGRSQTNVTQSDLRKTLASPEGKRGFALGNAERTAAENLEAAAPGHIPSGDGVVTPERLTHLAQSLAVGGTSPYRWYHLFRAIPRIKTDDRTLRLAARYFTEPDMARQGVALLQRAGASADDIARVIAAASGEGAAKAGKKK